MLDTNMCIYAIKNNPQIVSSLLKQNFDKGICISSITLSELMFGVENSSNIQKNTQALVRFLLPFSIFSFSENVAIEYGKIRAYLQKQGTPIGPLDTLIAAHAKAENCILVTHNTKEFNRVVDLQVEDWVL